MGFSLFSRVYTKDILNIKKVIYCSKLDAFGAIITITKMLSNVSCEFVKFLALLFVFLSAHLISQLLSTRINKYIYFKVERQIYLPVHLYSVNFDIYHIITQFK